MEEVVHIVPIGFSRETTVAPMKDYEATRRKLAVDSIKRFPVSKVILVLSDSSDLESEKKARAVANEVKKELGFTPTDEIFVSAEDVFLAAMKITESIRKEKKQGKKVVVNLSGSLRSISLAAYLAALVTHSEAYLGIPSFSKDNFTGTRKVIQVPPIPLMRFSPEKIDVLRLLKKEELSFDDIIGKLKPTIKKDTQAYSSEKSRLSHHINDLRKEGLIEPGKGKNIKIKLTEIGEMYTKGMDEFNQN